MNKINSIIIPNETKTNLQEIKNLEQKLGIQFPTDYKMFLMKYNGGKPICKELLIHLLISERFRSYAYLYKLMSVNEISHYYDMLFDDDEGVIEMKENHCVAIGLTNGLCAICICVDGDSKGKIFHYNGDFRLVYLADCLETFLTELKEDSDNLK